MLTADGCRQRRERLLACLGPFPDGDHIRLADPIHLMYLANFHVNPFSSSAGFGGILLLRSDGKAKLLHDNGLPDEVKDCHAEEMVAVHWYDAQTPAVAPRQLALLGATNPAGAGLRFHDRPGDPYAPIVTEALAELRRVKDADELNILEQCMRAGEAGHAWARQHVKPGMTELDVYLGISNACTRAAGRAVVVYGDFAVSPGPERTGGPPTSRLLQTGDLLILDFSVVIAGYRGDFTNTISVGGQPTSEQSRMNQLCLAAMAAGEATLCAGATCQAVFIAVDHVFAQAGVGQYFPHHAGHGLGLTHPEAPYIVRHSTESLRAGDVITLEPGLYIPGVGGMRIEHNYLITATGHRRLSQHVISLV